MDLFDLVRAAPPPKNVREPTSAAALAKSEENDGKGDQKAENESKEDGPHCIPKSMETLNSVDIISSEDNNDEDDGDSSESQSLPPKTKAQQKMFSEQPRRLRHLSVRDLKKCVVVIKRLRQSGNDCLTSEKDSQSKDDIPSPSKKHKTSNSKESVKISKLQNGAKQRAQTPPPKVKKSLKATAKITKTTATAMTKSLSTKSLIKKFGRRFFECVVRIKRLRMPEKVRTSQKCKTVSFSEAVEILGSKPRKSSSIASSPRIKAKSKLNSSVPTRLQRVDPTGNVLEDIELNSSLVLPSSTPTSSSRKSKLGRSSSCNGGRRSGKLKRPALRIPTTDLASLRIDDSHEEETEPDEEYIVPNEMPEYRTLGVQSAGAPNPLKRVTVTTTVSDEEGGDATETKKSKNEVEQVKSPPETIKSQKEAEQLKSSDKEMENVVQNLAKPVDAVNQQQSQDKQTESNKKPERKQPAQTETGIEQIQSKISEAESKDADLRQEQIKFGDKTNPNPEKKMEQLSVEPKTQVEPIEPDSEPLQLEKQQEQKSFYLSNLDITSDEVDSTASPSPTPNEQSASKVELVEFMPEMESFKLEKSLEEHESYFVNDSDATPDEVDSTATTPSPTADAKKASIEEYVIEDDILEIQTSFDDVRELHTPSSPMPPLQIDDSRSEPLASHDSESSFKSSSQMVINSGVEQLAKETSAATQIEIQSQTQTLSPVTALSAIQARRSTTSFTTEPLDMSNNTYNTREAASGPSIAQAMYSPIDMPSLDDEELDRFVDFFN